MIYSKDESTCDKRGKDIKLRKINVKYQEIQN